LYKKSAAKFKVQGSWST